MSSTLASTSASTNVRQEFNRLSLVESGITEDEFGDLLAYITNNPNKIPDIEENLKYGSDKVKVKYLRKLLDSEQPGASAKRTRENSIISTEGPLHPHEGALMLPVYTRDIFKEVTSGIYGGKSYIIHGPYQSGKTTFLLELKETIRSQSSNLKYFSMPEIKGDTLENKRRGFFKFISYRIFKEVLTETETIDKISELEIPYYVLIDEFQYIFTDNELLNVTKDFFQNISSSKVRYVAVGTFILVDLLNDDGELISPFNKASFKLMNLFDRREMGEIFKQYQLNLSESGVPSSLTAEIIKESCGHPASFMILLKLYHDLRPTVNKWGIKLQERLTEYMNGTHIKIKHEINRMDDDEKQYLRGLVEYMADHWYMDLSDLTALDDTVKKLLNFGILNIMDTNSVGFTSCIILRVCIDTLFSKPSSSPGLEDDISCDPVDLLMLGLSYIEPTIVADNRVLNKEGVGERIMQASLFCIFNDLLPRPKMCLLEVRAKGRERLDLMIVDGDKNLVAYSFKSNKTSESDFKDPLRQALSYANHYGMDINLVNFYPSGYYLNYVHAPKEIFLINVAHNTTCTQFTITLPSEPSYTQVVNTSSKKKLPDVKMSALLPNKPDFWPDDRAIPLDLVTVIESELALHREENARLMAKITGLEFKKAELIERVAKLEEKQLENVVIKNLLHASCEKYNHINKTGIKMCRTVGYKSETSHIALTILSCGHIFHRSCIEKQLLHTKPSTCPFPDCGKNVDIIVDPSFIRRGSQSSQSSGISAISNVISEKFVLNSPAIPEDLMEGIEDSAIPRNQLLCAKCLEEITADFPKDTVFLSCKHAMHYDCIGNPHKKCPTCSGEDLVMFPVEQASRTTQKK
ncbi:crinkler (CRN) family protein [Rhizophagus clarus]|uniref:Crinkler (CRN) family protein n=1 Tax=Rhizophagus clarus TaxID=94130 RepID=A0A8H3LYP5_9GLOM|nr:crinkler (CRN) family protein [Rhizophagus clarus]